ncbi:hypothetical protein [Nocardia sp. NPDC002869]|uniref:hypothetical protein n=1 Tax=Nocardia sp. NPDC002869 TaxID=3161032 RepID=UPI00398D03F1
MSAKKNGMSAESAGRKRLSAADYERMADDYAANPVQGIEVVGPVGYRSADYEKSVRPYPL